MVKRVPSKKEKVAVIKRKELERKSKNLAHQKVAPSILIECARPKIKNKKVQKSSSGGKKIKKYDRKWGDDKKVIEKF